MHLWLSTTYKNWQKVRSLSLRTSAPTVRRLSPAGMERGSMKSTLVDFVLSSNCFHALDAKKVGEIGNLHVRPPHRRVVAFATAAVAGPCLPSEQPPHQWVVTFATARVAGPCLLSERPPHRRVVTFDANVLTLRFV